MNITALNRLFERGETKGMKLGLETIRSLDYALGSPSRAFTSIHVGGTNGKGSVTTKIASCLQVGDRQVGVYTSPHIFSFQERIVINGREISTENVEILLEKIFAVSDQQGLAPTYFEILTLLAFLYFAEQNVKVAVLEVGMGGRWDATNIVAPIASVITSIDLDHTRYLGSTLEAIAAEKAGIIKPNTPVITGPQADRFAIFSETAQEKGAPYHALKGTFTHFEEENRALAQLALTVIPFSKVWDGLCRTPPCRFQRIDREIPMILDVGHNPAALRSLFARISTTFPDKQCCVVAAFSSDKEIEPSLEVLKQYASFIYLTEAPSPRAAPAQLLADTLNHPSALAVSDVRKAFTIARQRAYAHNEVLVACGTFFIMSTLLSELEAEKGLFDG